MWRGSKLFLLLVLSFSTVVLTAQETTSSPYSRYGMGTLLSQSFLQSFSMGGVGIGMRSTRNVNFSNPASYSALSLTTFEAGFTNSALRMEDGIQTENINYPHISHLSFGIPVMRNKWGMSFGMLPYSNVGYDYVNLVNDPLAGDVTYIQKGNGGLTKAYFGNALQFNIDSTTLISFGVNGYFMFGSLNHDQKVIYGDITNALNLWGIQQTAVADVGADYGVQLQKTFTNKKREKYKLTLGATYAMETDLSMKYTDMVRTFSGTSDFGTIKDTISLVVEEPGVLQLPKAIGVGISFGKVNSWSFAVDFKSAAWDVITTQSPLFSYNSNYAIAAGFQIVPKIDDFTNYLNRITYRFGGRYNTSYITIKGHDLPEYGITFGVELPLRAEPSSFPVVFPKVNIGVEYGKRGEAVDGLIEETFFKLNVGVTIGNRWFIKRKYD